MCLIVYAASQVALPTISWDESRPAFNVREVEPVDPVRGHFDFPFVYKLGSHEGCGCGFGFRDFSATEDEARPYRASAAALAAFLSAARRKGPVQVFASWSGEEERAHRLTREVLTATMAGNVEHWADVQPRASLNEVFAYDFELDR